MSPRRTTWFGRLALGIGAVLATALALEIGLRLLGIGTPRVNAVHLAYGYGGRPGVEAWHGHEGGALVRNNRRGFRDLERTFDKPGGTYRIATVGDSYVAAYQVARGERFTELLGGELEGLLEDRQVEVLNFGINGFGTAQELLVLRSEVVRYEPDLVLLAFFGGNDLVNNLRSLERNPYKAYFDLDADGELVLDDRFREALAARENLALRVMEACTDRSRLLQLLRHGLPAEREPHGPRAFDPDSGSDYLPEAGLRDEAYAVPAEGSPWAESWRVTEALLAAFRDEVEAVGARLVIVSLTTGIQVHPDPDARARFAARLGVADLDYPDRRLAEIGERLGVEVVLLAPALRARAESEGVFLHGFTNTPPGQGHWNALGHAAAAEVLARSLAPVLGP